MTTQKQTAGSEAGSRLRIRKWLLFSLACAAVFAGMGYLYLVRMAYHMTYHPAAVLAATPESEGLAYENVAAEPASTKKNTFRGRRITGWYIPSGNPDSPVVLYCHGNSSNMAEGFRLYKARLLHSLGLGVMMFDYAGFGQSRGELNEAGTYADARAMYYQLIKKGIPPERIILYGESLGTAVACQLALEVNAAALVLESPFTSLADMGKVMMPYLPARLIAGNRYVTIDRVGKIGMPLLVMHSREDELVPYSQGRKNFDTAFEPKDFVELSGTHSEGFKTSGAVYTSGLTDFLRKRLNYDAAARKYVVMPTPLSAGVKVEKLSGAVLDFRR